MIRIIHCADLHLSSSERDYSLSVLDEIVSIARESNARYLLLAGDLFDSFPDLEQLKGEFRKRIAPLAGACRIVAIPGNHEQLQLGANRLDSIDLGALALSLERPFALHVDGALELLLIPFAESYADYPAWNVPPKRGSVRIALAHGPVAGMQYSGGDDEGGDDGVLDPDLFARYQCDFVALGHIHGARTERVGRVTLSYPGSARVWRRGELGPRTVNRLDVGDTLTAARTPLARAGEYRRHELPLGLDGSFPDLATLASGWHPADWVELVVSGVIEDERALAAAEGELKRRYASVVRRFEVNRDDVAALAGIAAQPLARTFLERWREREPAGGGEEREVWLRAREIGLLKIKELLEARP